MGLFGTFFDILCREVVVIAATSAPYWTAEDSDSPVSTGVPATFYHSSKSLVCSHSCQCRGSCEL